MIDVAYQMTGEELFDTYGWLAEHINEVASAVTHRVVDIVAPDLLNDFAQEPGPVKTPIHWTSQKQKRYVQWAKKMGLIPSPFVRSHALSKGWELVVLDVSSTTTTVDLSNPAPETPYVVGVKQQRWHHDTGWYFAPDKAARWMVILVDWITINLIQAFVSAGDVKRGPY